MIESANRHLTPEGGALRGTVVIEFGQYAAGPLLGMLLADQGSRVIKVERPEGDPARRLPPFAIWNRGKESVVVDLKSRTGRETVRRLFRLADAVIENFRPGVAERLGIDYERATKVNPSVIYCSLPGFPPESPRHLEQGWDPVIAAATGAHQVSEVDSTPLYNPLLLPSTFAAIIAAGAMASALIARERFGRGQRVEVPLYNAMFATFGRYLVRIRNAPEVDPISLLKLPLASQYRCADGRYVQNHGTTKRFVEVFCAVAGHPEWTQDASALIDCAPNQEVVDLWRSRFEQIFLQRDSWVWEESINAAGGSCAVCRTIDEWLVHEHARRTEMVMQVDDPDFGRMLQPGTSVKLRGTPGAIRGGAPRLGEHTAEVLSSLRELTPSDERQPEIDKVSIPSPLAGIRVLDLCIILAGPACGRTLAEFGADVIKIDNPTRPTNRFSPIDVNRGKRSILLDVRSESGREVFWRLVETADVIIENFRQGKMEALGLGYREVCQRKPDVIYASMNAYGYGGPFSGRPGWEQNGQAVSGMEVRRGGRGRRPIQMTYPFNDYGTGLLAAYGVILALLERFRTGRGQQVDASLTTTACLLQSRYFFDFEGYERNEPEGADLLGESSLSRLYKASDGWFFLYGREPDCWSQLTAVKEFAHLPSGPWSRGSHEQEIASILADSFRTKPRNYWLTTLAAVGLSVTEHASLPELFSDQVARAAGLVVNRYHPGLGPVDHGGPVARLSRTPILLGRPAPVYGAESREILGEIGYGNSEIERLEADGTVVQARSGLVWDSVEP
jgi:crotonobetainyl-CoA:carnitine CoA-transferase CaiB-like acyl-CoA transferase